MVSRMVAASTASSVSVMRAGQVRQLLTTELTLSVQLIRKTDHAKLFLGIKTFDLLDDLLRCHTSMI